MRRLKTKSEDGKLIRYAVVILTIAICLTACAVADDAQVASEYRSDLVKLAALIDPSFNLKPDDLKDEVKRRETSRKVKEGLDRLKTVHTRYTVFVEKLIQKLRPHRVGGVTPKDVKELTATSVVKILKNSEMIVNDLNELALRKEQVKQLQAKIVKLEAVAEERNDMIARQKMMIKTHEKQIENFEAKLAELEKALKK